MRIVRPHLPDASGRTGGLTWNLFLPPRGEAPSGGVVVLHGAGSRKENHHDFARAAAATGIAALAVDLRGHGGSDGPMDGRAIADVAALAQTLRAQAGVAAVALRGSSMGGYLAIVAADASDAAAVVAICPAGATMLRRGLDAGRFDFRADHAAFGALLDTHDDVAAAAQLDRPLLLLHARGDESVPVEHSRLLADTAPRARLIEVPGGHHRSVQHDAELQAVSLRFLARELRVSAG